MAKDSNVNISLKQGGNSFGFFDGTNEYEVTALQLRRLLYDPLVYSILLLSTASTSLATVNISYNVGAVYISLTSNAAALSACLTSGCVAGQTLLVALRPGSVVSGLCVVTLSGVSLVTLFGLDNSKFTLYNSAASVGWVFLQCFKDGEWSVMGTSSATSVTFT